MHVLNLPIGHKTPHNANNDVVKFGNYEWQLHDRKLWNTWVRKGWCDRLLLESGMFKGHPKAIMAPLRWLFTLNYCDYLQKESFKLCQFMRLFSLSRSPFRHFCRQCAECGGWGSSQFWLHQDSENAWSYYPSIRLALHASMQMFRHYFVCSWKGLFPWLWWSQPLASWCRISLQHQVWS